MQRLESVCAADTESLTGLSRVVYCTYSTVRSYGW